MFPNFKWDDRTCDPADPTTLTYASFKAGPQNRPVGYEPSDDLFNFKILARGQHPAADKILDWLVCSNHYRLKESQANQTQEIGVKDALEKECLSKLELAFHTADGDPVSDANLIESYAMAFTYGDGGGITKIRTENSAQGVTSVVVRNAKQDAQTLLENVEYGMLRAAKYVPKLPSKLTSRILPFIFDILES